MDIMHQLFKQLEELDIQYLHFKSNTNINESFEGKADFDVLVDKARINEVEQVIANSNGKRFNPERYGRYPGVDNWIIFDDQTGILYHLHLHYQLATGKALIKDYVIPWNDIMFKTRIKSPEQDIYVTDPNLELLLLTVRSVLKSRFSDVCKAHFGKYKMHKSLVEEKKDLLTKSNPDTIYEYAKVLFTDESLEIVVKAALEEKVNSRDFLNLSKAIRKCFALNRRMSKSKANICAFSDRFSDVYKKILSRKFDFPVVTKKVSLEGGAIIAFVGPDGAGKSTITAEMQKWISRKIECKRFYMGTGDGKTSILGALLKRVGSSTVGAGDSNRTSADVKRIFFWKQPKSYIRKFFKMVLIHDVEKNNIKKIKNMHRYRLNGGISVLDRYPQIEIAGQNDGPKIYLYRDILGDSFLVRKYLEFEEKELGIVRRVKPDIVFRLNISAETALDRKDDLNKNDALAVSKFRQKVEDVKKLTYQGAKIVDIDAEQPFEQELLDIKRILWNEVL